jgi:elongation of very long chain fatty acids protein 4
MHDIPAIKFKNAKIAYNLFQILANTLITYHLYRLLNCRLSNPFGINTEFNNEIHNYIHSHYILKYFDFMDTFFIICNKNTRQLTFLHIYHHSSILLLWKYAIYIGDANGTVAFSAMINGFIHVIMYAHYLITSLGIQNPFKFLITKMQMTQFVLLITHSGMAIQNDIYISKHLCVIQIMYQFIMLLLFFNFYRKN